MKINETMYTNVDISVIVTFYNMEKFVLQSLSSIKCDGVSLEIIVIDDCSSDNTQELINNFVLNQTNKFVVFKTIFNRNNLGVSASRNLGIEYAHGKYITFIDGDDVLSDNSLKMRFNILEKTQASVVYGKYKKVDTEMKTYSKVIPITKSGNFKSLLKSNFIAIGSGMIRKSRLGKIRFRDIGSEDYMFWLEYLRANDEVVFLDELVLYYRIVNKSRSGNNSYRKLKLIKEIYKIYLMLDYSKYKSVYYTIRYTILRVLKIRFFKV